MFLLPALIHAQLISTIAGTGVQGYNGDNIPAATAQFNGLQGLAFDQAGNIYIADISNNRIRKITISTGIITTIAGTGVGGYNGDGILATAAQINIPSALGFDSNGDLFFTDRSNSRIRKITTSTGIISTVAGTGAGGFNGDGILATAAQLNNPNDVSFDAAGNLYIADWFNNRVRKVDKITGMISTVAGTGTAGYNGDGILATTAQINGPCGIIFDIAGNTYFAEYGGARVRKISVSTGLISTFAGTGTFGYNGDGIAATTAQLAGCAYIRFDAAENMYIGEGSNQRVRRVTKSSGLISTVAGTGTVGYNGDGIPATTAQLNFPFNIYFDVLNCDMYIADYYNNRLRKVTGGFGGCPSPVAPGNLSSCQVLPAVNITAVNNNSWVPVFDSSGNLAAMINANGNNLGTVNTSLYTQTGACREDIHNRLYLNRNITITPQNQPSSNVSVRLYILKAELDSLKNALNSMGQPSGVASINEVDVFRNNDACSAIGVNTALPLTATTGVYDTAYYLQVSVGSFSSFYFANKLLTYILPVRLSSFTGRRNGDVNMLDWEASCNASTRFIIQRSADGNRFEEIGNINVQDCNASFHFTDRHPLARENYYRLKIMETGGKTGYSAIILVPGDNSSDLGLHLAPAFAGSSLLQILLGSKSAGQITLIISDMAGRMVWRRADQVQAGSNLIWADLSSLTPGMYYLYAGSNNGRSNTVRFIKQ